LLVKRLQYPLILLLSTMEILNWNSQMIYLVIYRNILTVFTMLIVV
jgi:hypothetical protein